MVIVVETWRLKEEYAGRALELMQEMDDIVGPRRTSIRAGANTGASTNSRNAPRKYG